MAYNLGLDIGIASIGFAGVDIENNKVLFCGSHIFEAAENPKDGSSLAAPRREKRAARRIINRRAQRKKDVRELLEQHGLDTSNIDQQTSSLPVTPWTLRKLAFERRLTDAEFARVLFHIAKRRGFQSNRKGGVEPNDLEGKAVLSAAKDLEVAAFNANAPSIAAYLADKPRQRNGNDDYSNSIARKELRQEILDIFSAQKKYGNPKATDELRLSFAGTGDRNKINTIEGDGIAFYQRPLQSSYNMVGNCTFFPEEKRAPKFSYTAELFVMWSKINNCRIKSPDGTERQLNPNEKNLLNNLAHKNKSGVTYAAARKELELKDDEKFNTSYSGDKDDSPEAIIQKSEKRVLIHLPGYHTLKEALDTGSDTDWQNWLSHRREALDDIALTLSFYEDQKEVDERLSKHNLSDNQKEQLTRIEHFSKTVDLSLKAINKLLPLMKIEGLRYDEAKAKAGLEDKRKEKFTGIIPPFDNITNPVVSRALARARKIVNTCLKSKYGMPERVVIEIGKDVGRPLNGYWIDSTGKKKAGKGNSKNGDRYIKGRRDIEKENEKNWNHRRAAAKSVAGILGINDLLVTSQDILKYRLWEEQKNTCPYCVEQITPTKFKEENGTQIDHIIPYSLSHDDSMMNKVLVHSECNQEKRNQIPYDAWGTSEHWQKIKINAFHTFKPAKLERLLIEKYDPRNSSWKDRALNDTRYIARALREKLMTHLPCPVEARNGMVTAHMRGLWGFADEKLDEIIKILLSPDDDKTVEKNLEQIGLKKWHIKASLHARNIEQAKLKKVLRGLIHYKDRTNDRHHALDAIVIACSTQSMVQDVALQHKYNKKAREYPKPWESFREDALRAVYGEKDENGISHGGIFVSRMPDRKVTGAAHQDTIYSLRKATVTDKKGNIKESTIAVSRRPLKSLIDLKKKDDNALYDHILEKIEQIHHKEDRARVIYETLKNHIETCRADGIDPKTVFDDPIHMPPSSKAQRNGKTKGEIIKHVRINEGYKTGLILNTGPIAKQSAEAEKLGAIAPNTQGGMVRVDVFSRKDKKGKEKYYLCPVYVYHFAQRQLPNRVVKAHTDEKDWPIIDDSYTFLFSLYSNDLVRIRDKKGEDFGYYKGTHRGTGAINLITHDGSFNKDGIGVQNLELFEKYTVNYFGRKYKVKGERRLGVEKPTRSKSLKAVAQERTASSGE